MAAKCTPVADSVPYAHSFIFLNCSAEFVRAIKNVWLFHFTFNVKTFVYWQAKDEQINVLTMYESKILCRSFAGAKRAAAPQPDPTRGSSKNVGDPYVSEVPPAPLELHWRPLSPRCRPFCLSQNLTFAPKTVITLVKMNVLNVRSPPTATQRRSEPRRAR